MFVSEDSIGVNELSKSCRGDTKSVVAYSLFELDEDLVEIAIGKSQSINFQGFNIVTIHSIDLQWVLLYTEREGVYTCGRRDVKSHPFVMFGCFDNLASVLGRSTDFEDFLWQCVEVGICTVV